jgi:tRNA(Met) C34 N-acetyltransferase TmcA
MNPIELAILAGELPPAEREHRFAKPRRWAFDWAWPEAMVALEIEGGLYGRGRKCALCGRRLVAGHTSIERLRTDMEKYNAASLLGWRVLRVTPEQAAAGVAVALVKRALEVSDGSD